MEETGSVSRARTASEAGLTSPVLERGTDRARPGGKEATTGSHWSEFVIEDKERSTKANSFFWCRTVGCLYHVDAAVRRGDSSSFCGGQGVWVQHVLRTHDADTAERLGIFFPKKDI